MELTFYTRKQCPLCEDAKVLLLMLQENLGFELIERDISEKDEWTEAFGLMIPVVEAGGELLQYGMIDPAVIEDYVINHKN